MENEATKNKKLSRKKKIFIAVIAFLIIILIILLFIILKKKHTNKNIPVLTIVTPAKQSISDKENFTVDVELSGLGDVLYPAASLSIVFDPSRLEFMGIEEGNVMTLGDERADGSSYQLPDWSVDIKRSNEIGQINVMYLDLTGGKYAFSKDCLDEDDSLLMRLSFRLRGSAKAGDVYDLTFADAAFAASDESKSLASIKNTLKTENGKVVVKE